jgi:hypothetical protein
MNGVTRILCLMHILLFVGFPLYLPYHSIPPSYDTTTEHVKIIELLRHNKDRGKDIKTNEDTASFHTSHVGTVLLNS